MDNSKQIVWLDEIDSTNKYAVTHYDELENASLIVASRQTAGKGRHQRVWVSPPDENIYASFVVKDFPHPLHKASWIGSLAVLDMLNEEVPGLKAWLKWPNDVYCADKKLAGLLCEGVASAGKSGVVIGIGINVNMSEKTLNEIDQPATSILRETGQKLILKKIIKTLAKFLSKRYITGFINIEAIFNEWKSRNFVLNKTIEVATGRGGEVLKGKVVDIGIDGDLNFDTGKEILKLFSGDVRINKKSLFE